MVLTSAKNNEEDNKFQDPFKRQVWHEKEKRKNFLKHIPHLWKEFQHKLTSWLYLLECQHTADYWSLSSHWVEPTVRKNKWPSKMSANSWEIQNKVSIKKAKAIFRKCRYLFVKWNLYLPKWASRTSGIQCVHHAPRDPYRCLRDSTWKSDQ